MRELFEQYIKPYLVWLKVALLAAVFTTGWIVSCSHYKKADVQVDLEQSTKLATCLKANYDYAEEDKKRAAVAAAQQAEQARLAAAAQAEADEAQKRAQTLANRLAAIEKKQRAADADPKCRDIMELEVCPALR